MGNTINSPQKISSIDTMLTIEDIMKNLHIKSKTTAYKLLKLDTFPSIKIGKNYLVPESEYNKWVK